MLILISVVLVLVPALAIIYPFLIKNSDHSIVRNEQQDRLELQIRLDNALLGLKDLESERLLGTLSDKDYLLMKDQYLLEASMLIKSMES
jgi:predicted PurR-regulated permease PerM